MEQIILFAFLILFPFGTIIKIGTVNPIDIVVGLGALTAILKRYKTPEVFRYFFNFLFIAAFTFIASVFVFKDSQVLTGLLYLVRLAAYFYFLIFILHFKDKKSILNFLLAISVISAVFGWIQYFLFPDFRALIEYGWDDHLYRMVGTFLDPAFLGLILVFGLTISLHKKKNLLSLFLLASIAFTYSRASYIAALVPLVYKKARVLSLVFAGLILFLPRTAGEGVKLERTASISARLDNYRQTFEIFKGNPLFGVGFNNICLAKDADFESHSCSGADSSLLFILTTTGVAGFLGFIYLIYKVWKNSDDLFRISGISLLLHSLFANSLFYPWILGFIIILFGLSLRREVED
ncbi:MAG: Oligosaccharide repeat unit polymerase Wzy [Candidatus Woesebacteria bacterium GW2011_GWB1_45_5]|uniref:Oligosaccharide repeat unit polymerase Wzy n=1 Tax=Candidatus Woesebacteria bacterium GW2011_GWB1_45_5 TaxID=1618581 RepID=A0A0G1MLB8_9BACT|nr:MAG: Oligosaccharide repeat unit polymerase Wzy [Candidatus Woesebacteria bacterium GW2011_GWB1_45_5]